MSKILQVENLVQEFNLTKDFLDKVKFKNVPPRIPPESC